MSNKERDEALYRYPGSSVLRNKLDIRDKRALDKAERLLVTQRARQPVPQGRFDLDHLCAIHHHLFQDIYPWAGEVRQVDIFKGQSAFLPHGRIPTAMTYVHKRLEDRNYLRRTSQTDFAREAASIIGEINYIHPFREGNGRAQLHYLKAMGKQAGHAIDLARLYKEPWMEASIDAARDNPSYNRMQACIEQAMGPSRSRPPPGRER